LFLCEDGYDKKPRNDKNSSCDAVDRPLKILKMLDSQDRCSELTKFFHLNWVLLSSKTSEKSQKCQKSIRYVMVDPGQMKDFFFFCTSTKQPQKGNLHRHIRNGSLFFKILTKPQKSTQN
jgi:hypothetical protein